MSREILFKAKRADNGEWVEGYVVKRVHNEGEFLDGKIKWEMIKVDYIFPEIEDCCYKIIPETLCQFTGLRDKHGNRIWENDIVQSNEFELKGVIIFDEYCRFMIRDIATNSTYLTARNNEDIAVIGNIFDNSELLSER